MKNYSLKFRIDLGSIFDPKKSILHIPHSSYEIPAIFQNQFLLSENELTSEINKMTDHLTDSLFELSGAQRIIFPASRLLVDPERFPEDGDEPMSLKGMGVIYTKTSGGSNLRRPLTKEEKTYLLEEYYWKHHQKFNSLCEKTLNEHGEVFIIDCHSYPKIPLPYEDNKLERPDICIGFEKFHSCEKKINSLVNYFESMGFSVGFNSPFAGSIVPSNFYLKENRVKSIMIEVRRDLYLEQKI